MTRLSDLLRGAADRAPLGDASVSLSRAARRVRTQRGVRGIGNGVAGLGAFALVVFGVVQPGLANSAVSADALAPESAPGPAGGAEERDSLAASDQKWMAWGTCGSFPLQDYGYGDTDALSIATGFDGASTPEGGTTLDIPVTVTSSQDLQLTTNGPEAVILWEGMVVAIATAGQADQALALSAGDTVGSVASLALVDCFGGEPLPASKYELVVSQAFVDWTATPAPEPTVGPDPEPTAEPQPRITVPPDFGDPMDAGGEDAGEGSSGEASIAPTEMTIMPVEPPAWDDRITAAPVGFAVAGEPVDNPFADYYPEPWTPPAQPDDMLTPDIARGLFDATATTDKWDMAKGTSRWILPGGYGQATTFAPVPENQGFFGCSWDGVSGLSFPARSADLDLLALSADAPRSLSVSYGWVVDGNPEVTLSVTNTSSYSVPGFYGEPNRSLYLVKDGRVVAEAYPTNVNPNGQLLAKQAGGVALAPTEEDPDAYWGLLAPGESVSGTYLWRDVTGCWREDGSSTSITAGTYTLLTMQNLSLQQLGTESSVGDVAIPEPATLDADALVDPAIGTATTIAPVQDDWLEFQVWTSLGTVTITTH